MSNILIRNSFRMIDVECLYRDRVFSLSFRYSIRGGAFRFAFKKCLQCSESAVRFSDFGLFAFSLNILKSHSC